MTDRSTPTTASPFVSVIITAHNEGDEVAATVDSVSKSTDADVEIIVVDEASTDGSCDALDSRGCRVIRHPERIGVAHSRREAAQLASGQVFLFLDGHQRLSRNCIEDCAALAARRRCIVWPEVRGFDRGARSFHGATFQLCDHHRYFTASWRTERPIGKTIPITSLRAPGYFIPRSVFDRVAWPETLRGWGGSEAAISLKAFFTRVPLVHLRGPVAMHLFRKQFHYPVNQSGIWRNQALIARTCFEERTWYEYWYPTVFEPNLDYQSKRELESEKIKAEQAAFSVLKRRPDSEFWTELLGIDAPSCARSSEQFG